MDHVFFDREDDLLHCKVCGGAEGSLPTDCPAVRMTPETEESVYAGQINFTKGEWVKKN